MRWPSVGASARASPIWTTTSWAALCATTMTRTSWLRCTASATPTNLTSRASRRHTRITLQKGVSLSTRRRCLTSSPTTATNPKWTSWGAILRHCPSPLAIFSALSQHTGTHPAAPFILGQPWQDIPPPTPTWAHTTEDQAFHTWTEWQPKCKVQPGCTWAEPCLKWRWYDATVCFYRALWCNLTSGLKKRTKTWG